MQTEKIIKFTESVNSREEAYYDGEPMESIRALLLGIDYTSTNARALHRAEKGMTCFLSHYYAPFLYLILIYIDNKVKLISSLYVA